MSNSIITRPIGLPPLVASRIGLYFKDLNIPSTIFLISLSGRELCGVVSLQIPVKTSNFWLF